MPKLRIRHPDYQPGDRATIELDGPTRRWLDLAGRLSDVPHLHPVPAPTPAPDGMPHGMGTLVVWEVDVPGPGDYVVTRYAASGAYVDIAALSIPEPGRVVPIGRLLLVTGG